MKPNWPTKKLGECLIQFDRGISWSRKDEGGTIAVLRIPNIQEGYINPDGLKYISVKNENGKLDKSDIVMVASNGNPDLVGRSALVTEKEQEMSFASFLVRLRFDDTKLLPHYAHLFLLTPIFKRELRRKIATTSGIYNLRKDHIEKVKIPLPPLKIQKQIVERMDKITEAQKLNDELIQKSDELFQSFLHKELDPTGKNWNLVKLSNIVQNIEYGLSVSVQNRLDKNGVPILTMAEIENDGQINYQKARKISASIDEFKKFQINKGELLFNWRNEKALIGKTGLFGSEKEFIFASFLLRIVINEKIIPEFLWYWLNYLRTKNAYFRYAHLAGNQASFNANSLRDKILCPLIPIREQKQIVAKLSAAQEYKKRLLEQKLKLKELFDSVLHKSMNGERRNFEVK